jgi:hypothetical protein
MTERDDPFDEAAQWHGYYVQAVSEKAALRRALEGIARWSNGNLGAAAPHGDTAFRLVKAAGDMARAALAGGEET